MSDETVFPLPKAEVRVLLSFLLARGVHSFLCRFNAADRALHRVTGLRGIHGSLRDRDMDFTLPGEGTEAVKPQ